MMNGAFAAYGAGGNNILFANMRTRDMLCSSSQGLPSSGGVAFIGPCTSADPVCYAAKWNVAVDYAGYWNLCNTPSYNQEAMTRADFRSTDFVPRTSFKAALCQ